MPEVWKKYASDLLARLRDRLDFTPELEALFWAVPRHQFVDVLYTPDPATSAWIFSAAPADRESAGDWLGRIYTDVPLVTAMDDHPMPTCSNSMPSLVFRILAWLDVRPGNHVLEIGTGTGQLTALLAQQAGSQGSVVSLELDSALAADARSRLGRLFPGAPVSIREADAGARQPLAGTFDAVVATASCWPIPSQWLAVLAPGGHACVELRGKLSGALLLACAREDPADELAVSGVFDGQGVFMELRQPLSGVPDGLTIPPEFGEQALQRAPADGLGVKQMRGLFGWYCQLEIPEAEGLFGLAVGPGETVGWYLWADGGFDAVLLPKDGAVPGSELISYGGTSSLLERLLAAWKAWHEDGQPQREEFSFEMGRDGTQRVLLRAGERSWTLQ